MWHKKSDGKLNEFYGALTIYIIFILVFFKPSVCYHYKFLWESNPRLLELTATPWNHHHILYNKGLIPIIQVFVIIRSVTFVYYNRQNQRHFKPLTLTSIQIPDCFWFCFFFRRITVIFWQSNPRDDILFSEPHVTSVWRWLMMWAGQWAQRKPLTHWRPLLISSRC